MNTDNSVSATDLAKAQLVSLLRNAVRHLNNTLLEEGMLHHVPMEVQSDMEQALRANLEALQLLEPKVVAELELEADKANEENFARKLGELLAYIDDYTRNEGHGSAPTQAEMKRYFYIDSSQLKYMLNKLEQQGDIRQIPKKRRGIVVLADRKKIPFHVRRRQDRDFDNEDFEQF